MRTLIATVGSRGDVQPYVALGEALSASGHDVVLATHEPYERLVRGRGLEFTPLVGDPMTLLRETRPGSALRRSGANWPAFIWAMLRLIKPRMRELWDQILDASADADAVLYSYASFPAYHVAEYRRIPSVFAGWGPTVRTAEFPHIMASRLPFPLGPFGNRLTHSLFEQFAWQPVAPSINAWRRELGLRPVERAGLFHRLRRERHPGVLGYSPAVVQTPSDWPDYVHATGYWFLDPPADYEPPEAVADFLDRGEPPVYVGFGSMIHDRPEEALELVLAALRRTGFRAVLEGFGSATGELDPELAIQVDEVPHGWLFPRLSAAVHHGGVGTTGASLRAGLPTVVCPFFGDQFFWADRVARLGVGPVSAPYAKLSVERLAGALEGAVRDEGIKARAGALGERVRAERGVETAVELIERYTSDVLVGRDRATA